MPKTPTYFVAPNTSCKAAPLLRSTFVLESGHGDICSATLRLSALGVIEGHINGHLVSDELFTPGWTSYEWRLRYSKHDVITLLKEGKNALGLVIGNGWYKGRLGWKDGAEPYGEEIAGWAELTITFSDGYEQIVGTDDSWRSTPSEITSNSLYDGETIDARQKITHWDCPNFDDETWDHVHKVDRDTHALEPYMAPPVRRLQEVLPTDVISSPSGKTILDFGQNLVGWVKVMIKGQPGQEVTLRFAEVLEDGEISVRPLRYAKATDRFILSGTNDIFEPTFTFHGFRYVEVDGWPIKKENLQKGAFTAIVVGSDLNRISNFSTSNPLLNQLHQNIVWGMRGNFLDIPTDCPQRDERLGWTGDISVFAPTAAFLFDVNDFLRDWLHDLAEEQRHQNGIVPFIVPDIFKRSKDKGGAVQEDVTAIWSDAVVWVPWALWQAYGDQRTLKEMFDPMVSHLRRARGLLSDTGVWDKGFQFGDWLDPDASPDSPEDAKANSGVVATAALYRSAKIGSEVARVLGRNDEEQEFAAMANKIKCAFKSVYVTNKRIYSDCTTVYSLAIVFGLLEPEEMSWAGKRLAELVASSGHHISTGFAGTPFISDALTITGHIDDAYSLLLQQECPSWLYPVTMGATTIWERWDSMLPDGSINPGDMTSFNHYALGAVADWMHRVIGGISPIEPGYKRVLIAPCPGGGITWANTSLETPHGKLTVRWNIEEELLHLRVNLPQGTSALVRIRQTEHQLTPGSHNLTFSIPIESGK